MARNVMTKGEMTHTHHCDGDDIPAAENSNGLTRIGRGRGRGRGAILKESARQAGKLYIPQSIVDSKSGSVLPAIPGQCKVQESWKNIIHAPIAYQMQQMIGDQYSDHALELKTKKNQLPVESIGSHTNNGFEFQESPNSAENIFRGKKRMVQKENSCISAFSNRHPSRSDHSRTTRYLASNSSLDSSSSSSSVRSSRDNNTKVSFVGSNNSIPTLADDWVPLDFDTRSVYNNSQFSGRR